MKQKEYPVATTSENNLAHTVEKLSKQLQYSSLDEKHVSDSAQAMEVLNKDERNDDGFSTIDHNTDLSHNQVVAVTKLEGLSKLNFMVGDESPDNDEDPVGKIVRIFQRKQVSKNRQGRREAVDLFRDVESKKDAKGFWERWFSPKE
jgi:hypothetical protein